MKPRLRRVTVDASFAAYLDTMFKYVPSLKKSWRGAEWMLAHSADRYAEAISGSLYMAIFRLGDNHPEVRIAFEMTPELVHIKNGDFVGKGDPSA